MYYVYVLQNVANEKDFYVGSSKDLKARLSQHNRGEQAATKGRTWQVVYYEAYINERVARQREQKLKQNGRMRTLLMDRIKSQFDSTTQFKN